jgi:hypothetical protein
MSLRSVRARFPESAEDLTSHRVFRGFHWACPDDLSGGSRLKDGRLFRERIDALPLFGGGFLDDDELGEAGDNKGAVLLQFLVTTVARDSMTPFTCFFDRSECSAAIFSIVSDFDNVLPI